LQGCKAASFETTWLVPQAKQIYDFDLIKCFTFKEKSSSDIIGYLTSSEDQ
jgi:hypothetical protein